MNEYVVAGLMSGTSLDGLDIALCKFRFDKKWSYEIVATETFDYTPEWKLKLSTAHVLTGIDLAMLDTELGELHGNLTLAFLQKNSFSVDFISSHGHTVFHQPDKKMTLQIGSPAHLAATTGKMVVADFRTQDVALGGQGAPLVPIGDLLLFDDYPLCLNLGGIANISMKHDDHSIKAFDICPCNMVLNYLASKLGHDYDNGGALARGGSIDEMLLTSLNARSFYQLIPPKSLGKEFFDAEIFPLITKCESSTTDILRTFIEHIAQQIAHITSPFFKKKLLITGGGALNTFLIERISALSAAQIAVPDLQTIQFKEALIFAFLGVLRVREEPNCLREVTGAVRNHCSGAIYLP